MDLVGGSESYALLQVWGPPSGGPSQLQLGNLGTHAIAFTGRASLLNVTSQVSEMKNALDDSDDPVSYDVNIVVGPEWRDVKQVAPLVVVTDVYSNGTDSDDQFQITVEPRTPAWSVTDSSPKKIVLHVKVTQAGEKLFIYALSYSVTATGDLRHVETFIP